MPGQAGCGTFSGRVEKPWDKSFALWGETTEARSLEFYYDPKTHSSIDRTSGIIVRPSSRFSGDAGERYYFIDPNCACKTDDGQGSFEFGAYPLRDWIDVETAEGRHIRKGISAGYEIDCRHLESAFSRYLIGVDNRLDQIKSILTAAFIAKLAFYEPGYNFRICYR
jgi:hypothetical protein